MATLYSPDTILYSRGVEYFLSLSPTELFAVVAGVRGTEDPLLAALAAESGFDGLPQSLSMHDLYQRAKGRIMYRGVGAEEHAQAFIEGKYWAGRGAYGSGTYAVKGDRVQAGRKRAEKYAGEDGAIITLALALDEEVRLLSLSAAEAERTRHSEEFEAHLVKLLDLAQGDVEKRLDLQKRAAGARAIYVNLGRFSLPRHRCRGRTSGTRKDQCGVDVQGVILPDRQSYEGVGSGESGAKMTAVQELGVQMSSVADVVRIVFGQKKHARYVDYAVAFEFAGEEKDLPEDVREMFHFAREAAKDPLAMLNRAFLA